MKLNEHIKTFLSGMAIGAGCAVPGVSGGTIAVILGVYQKIVWAVSNIFKHFKEAFRVLLPTLLGVILALIPTIYLMDKALYGFVFGAICLFAGFILGSIPGIKDEVKDVKPASKHIITLIISLLLALLIGVASFLVAHFGGVDLSNYFYGVTPIWFYFVLIPVGFIASVALVVPGISGSMLLLLIGFYTPLIGYATDTVKACFSGDWSGFGSLVGILFSFAIGVVFGFYFISKLMKYLLDKHHDLTFYAILGFVIGSVGALFVNFETHNYYMTWASGSYFYMPLYIEIPIGIVLLVGALIGSYLLVRYKRKVELKEKEIAE